MIDYIFTDKDVQDNPALQGVVKEYLQCYRGNVSFLVNAKEFLQVQGNLPATTILHVLRCIAMKPDWADRIRCTMVMPIPQFKENPPAPFRGPRYVPPPRILLKATFNMPYLVSTWKTAYLCHLLNNSLCHLYYYPATKEYVPVFDTWCKLGFGRREHLTLVSEVPQGRLECRRLECRRCRKALDKYVEETLAGWSRKPEEDKS